MGTSGILAAVAAGITVNVTDLQRQDFVAERISTQRLWALVETVFNGTIFLLLGLQLPQIVGEPLIAAGSAWWRPLAQALVITLALLALRWIWLRVGVHGQIWRAHVRGQSSPPTSMRETLAATLAGIRGAITLAGALSVPLLLNDGSPFPQRQTLIFLATCCILYTLAIGSVFLPIVLRGLPQPAEDPLAREERQARIVECRAALAELAQAPGEVPATETARLLRVQDAAGRIAEDYRKRLQLLEGPQSSEEPEVQAESPRALAERHLNLVAEMEIRLNVLRAERNALYGERRANRINDESLRRLGGELDLQEVALRQRLRTARQVAEANQATGDAAP
jgi:CPA1 family monovalent cation:H+ antiporter